jgi:hypothetical protein
VNDTAATVAAQENWWGSSDTAAIAATVRDGADRDGVGRVNTSAFLPVPPDFSLSEIP